jgi:hypothetical protein
MVIVVVMSLGLGVVAYANESIDSQSVDELSKESLLEKMLTEAFNNEEKGAGIALFTYIDGKEVDALKKQEIKELYENSSFEEIRKLLRNEDIDFAYTVDKTIGITEKTDLKVPYQEIEVTRSYLKFHEADDSTGRFHKEWQVKIEGSFVYENLENQILTAENLGISLTVADWGVLFIPKMSNNVTYPPVINGSSVYFSAKHTMLGDYVFNSILLGTYDFGTYTDGFTATP